VYFQLCFAEWIVSNPEGAENASGNRKVERDMYKDCHSHQNIESAWLHVHSIPMANDQDRVGPLDTLVCGSILFPHY
jgi:hypothetical protein